MKPGLKAGTVAQKAPSRTRVTRILADGHAAHDRYFEVGEITALHPVTTLHYYILLTPRRGLSRTAKILKNQEQATFTLRLSLYLRIIGQ
jgi:hypothetical protein